MTSNPWQPVDKLPEKAGRYLVTQCGRQSYRYNGETDPTPSHWIPESIEIARLGKVTLGLDEIGPLKWWRSKHVTVDRITHWMPLPEPPSD